MKLKDLISKEHLKQNRQMHARRRSFGGGGWKWAEHVRDLLMHMEIDAARSGCKPDWLDYGCGEETLHNAVVRLDRRVGKGCEYQGYDPGVRGKDVLPSPAHLVTCTDALEHVEPGKLDAVLAHINELTGVQAFLVIALNPANKTLPNGSNTHLILESPEWWMQRVAKAMRMCTVTRLKTQRENKDLALLVERSQ